MKTQTSWGRVSVCYSRISKHCANCYTSVYIAARNHIADSRRRSLRESEWFKTKPAQQRVCKFLHDFNSECSGRNVKVLLQCVKPWRWGAGSNAGKKWQFYINSCWFRPPSAIPGSIQWVSWSLNDSQPPRNIRYIASFEVGLRIIEMPVRSLPHTANTSHLWLHHPFRQLLTIDKILR